jgi:hypothetical protein
VAEARKLKSGRWRIYAGAELEVVREPVTGALVTFETLTQASRWWAEINPREAPLREARRCARCGAYFGPRAPWTVYSDRYYHPAHLPTLPNRR